MTRSAVRSRLAPPRFALWATRGAAAQSPKVEAWCPAKPAGRRRTGSAKRGFPLLPREPRRPLLHEARHTLPEIAASQRNHHLAVGIDGRFRQRLERHLVKLALDHGDCAWRDEI